MPGFSYVRLYADASGESHFEDCTIDYPDARMISEQMPLTAWNVRTNTPSYDLDFHCAPRRHHRQPDGRG